MAASTFTSPRRTILPPRRALQQGTDWLNRASDLDDFVADYLSERHRADLGNGCALAALGADIARQGDGVRRGLTAGLRAQLDRFADFFKDRTAARRRKRAIATLAGLVGALTLA